MENNTKRNIKSIYRMIRNNILMIVFKIFANFISKFYEILEAKAKEENLDVVVYYKGSSVTNVEFLPHNDFDYEEGD